MSYIAAVYSGLFDPIHIGHVNIVKNALEKLNFDLLYIVLTANPPHKKPPLADAESRMEMVKKAFSNYHKIIVSDYEIKKSGYTYTYETLSYFYKISKNKPYFLMGSDNVKELHKWKNYKIILDIANIIVIERPDNLIDLNDYPLYKKSMQILKTDTINISSTKIKDMIIKGHSINKYIPEEASEVIKKKRLYNFNNN